MKNTFMKIGIPVFLLLGFVWVIMGMPPHSRIGFAPEQPIHYSHKLHAGDLGMDCQYCHSTVSFSKKAAVPSSNICLNCHATIRERYNEKTDEFEPLPQIDKLYNEYIDKGESPQWVRVHNLPDHVRFSHAPHIKAFLEKGQESKEACKLCHGDIASMEVVTQVKSLNMGYCVSCHRENKDKGAKVNCSTCHY